MTASFITRAEVNSQFATASALNNEIFARQAADSTLTTNLNAEIVRASITEVNLTTNVAVTVANLNNEIAARVALGNSVINLNSNLTTIIANLNNEIVTRSNSDITLTTNLGAEITRASSAEVTLATTIASNVATLTANLNTEITTRIALGTAITSDVTLLTTNLAIVNSNLNTEISARISLGTSLTTETSRATVAENSLAATIATINSTGVISGGAGCSAPSASTGMLEYWMDSSVAANETISMTIMTANLNGYVVKILGVGFSSYYNPQFQVSFICNFYNPAFGNKTTFGVVIYDPVAAFLFYHVECPVPVIAMALPVTISLYKSTGQLYPFGGFNGANILTVLYYWTSVATTAANTLAVTGLGFNLLTAQKYKCVFTGKNSTNGVAVKTYFNTATNLTLLNCGQTPAGFAVVSGSSSVNLSIFEVNADNSTGYPVQPIGSVTITYSTCLDGAKDGDETDVDCGGGTCGLKCELNKFCIINTDCVNYCAGGICIASTVFFFLDLFACVNCLL